ncbi:MAG: putative porin [Acinetobacter sp.]|nr:MAG: putative porin [Acinetobacter sp.]
MKKLSLATAVLTSVFAMGANAYQAEIGGTLGYIDAGDGVTVVGVDGTYYFAPVQTKNGPLNEAAFLNRASNIHGALSYDDLSENTAVAAGVEYFVPNSDFYLHADLGTDGEDVTTYAAEVGYLPVSNFLVAVGIAGADVDGGSNESDPTLRAKYVTNLGGFDVNLEGDLVFGDDTAFGLGGDVYLDKTFSVGAGYADDGVSGTDGVFSIRAKKFFTQQVSLEANIDFVDDANAFGVRGAYRF